MIAWTRKLVDEEAGAPGAAEDGRATSRQDDDLRNGNEVRHLHYSRSRAGGTAGQSRVICGWCSAPRFRPSRSTVSPAFRLYEHELRFALCHIDDEYANVKRDGVEIHLCMAWPAHPQADAPTSVGSATCKIQLPSLERLCAELQKRNVVHPDGHLTRREGNTADFTILDSDGTPRMPPT